MTEQTPTLTMTAGGGGIEREPNLIASSSPQSRTQSFGKAINKPYLAYKSRQQSPIVS